ncbi:MAG: hypothetical protein M3256_00220 [Actinomycetota bacterium]|nr:hypothetical protein [Actinomycetota bacterium]
MEDADLGCWSGRRRWDRDGGDILSLLKLAIQSEVPIDRLRQMIYAYPTFTV